MRMSLERNEALKAANRYNIAHSFLCDLRAHHRQLTRQQFMTLRGQALAGDISGAKKGLAYILGEKYDGE